MTVEPKLRFAGFSDEWEEKTLGDVGIFKSGTGFPHAEQGGTQGVPFYKVSDMNLPENKIYMNKANHYVTEKQINKLKVSIIQQHSIIFAKVGAAVFLERKRIARNFLIDNNMMAYIPNNYQNLFFFKIYFDSIILSKYAQTGALPSYNASDLKIIKTCIPSLPEQQKIANFFAAVDEAIEALQQKKQALDKYKQGVMQQIFTQKLRFTDEKGSPYPAWEERRLSEVSDVRDGTHDSPQYQDEGFPLITSKNLTSEGTINFDNINLISLSDYDNINKRSGVSVNDILFGMIGTIGKPVLVKETGFAIKNIALVKEITDLLNIYLIHYLHSDFITQQFDKENKGGTQKFLSLTVIRNLQISIPALAEQQKIADYLSAIDEKIDALKMQINQAQSFKKFLMQKMFV